jgi:hypothetical protein
LKDVEMDERRSDSQTTDDVGTAADDLVVESPDVTTDEAEPVRDRSTPDPERPYRIAAWLVIVGALALAGLLVSLPAHVYDRGLGGRVTLRIRHIDVVELWRVQTNNLPEIGQPALIEALFVGSVLVFVLGSAYLIWIATVDIRPTPRAPMVASDTPGESEPA